MLSAPFRSVLLTVLGLTVIGVIVSHELIASPRQIKDAISDGVTEFDCPDLNVEEPSGSWNSRRRSMRAALWMPPSCIADLLNQVRSSSLFVGESCNIVEKCWIRRTEKRTYTFIFHRDYVSFRLEER